MRNFFICIILCLPLCCSAQIPKKILTADRETYLQKDFRTAEITPGVYRLGASEGDQDLLIIPHGNTYMIQFISGAWGKSYYTREHVWIHKYTTFDEVRADSNQLQFGKYKLQFATYLKNQKCILVNGSILQDRLYGKDTAHMAFYVSNVQRYYQSTDLYELALELKSPEFFHKKSTRNLELMRYTLYAKYGQVFRLGGEMDEYFKKKDWYEPSQTETSHLFNVIERVNLKMLEEEEKTRVPLGRESEERED